MHGYPKEVGVIDIECQIVSNLIHINIFDYGVGIKDLSLALEPFYTSREDDERSGMGFTIMETFMDEILIDSNKDKGTKITLIRKIKKKKSKA